MKRKRETSCASRPVRLAFDDFDVAVDGKSSEALHEATGLRPLDFEPVDFFVFGETENDARIVRREIAAAADLETRLLQIASLIGNVSADGIRIGFRADEMKSEPVIPTRGIVVEQEGSAIVDGNEHVESAIVVEVAEGESAGGELA